MAKLRLKISMSLDGFVAGPNQSVDNPLGIGGMRLHDWIVPLAAWRKTHGMPSSECNGGRQPSGLRLADGTLWFPTQGGIAVLDPSAVQVPTQAPSVVLEEITTDRRSLPASGPIEPASPTTTIC